MDNALRIILLRALFNYSSHLESSIYQSAGQLNHLHPHSSTLHPTQQHGIPTTIVTPWSTGGHDPPPIPGGCHSPQFEPTTENGSTLHQRHPFVVTNGDNSVGGGVANAAKGDPPSSTCILANGSDGVDHKKTR
ncbi:hypothetical protein ZHAS_00013705 [Anopheles sinensis]|uniref:Uncharacterized protein n=1 Tax=Anopheles sinensis TaxID=74873 RepID=A0A084W691_ANOSI|nr:hypothetical protein ZHAS_00013705 [Anopheles sinensis]